MLPSLEKEFTRLEHQLDQLLDMVKPLNSQQQNYKPDPATWSILQVFRHMMQSEGQINKYLRKKIQGVNATPKAGILSALRSFVLNAAMRLPLRYQVPDAIKVDLEEQYVYETLATDWRAIRKEIRDFLEMIDEPVSRRELFRHPSVGRMTIEQGLTFMQVHLERHTHQVERLMGHSNFPG